MKRKLVFVLGILLFFSFVIISCNTQTSNKALIGKWIWEEEECTVEFFKDGTVTFSEDDSTWKTTYSWKTTKDRLLTLKWIGDEEETDFEGTCNFKISGSELTINFDFEAVTFKKLLPK
jgi:hypothetical protein